MKKQTAIFRYLFLLAFMFIGLQISAQVRGTIVDTSEEPLIGVSVVVKGSTTITITNYEGSFTIDAKKGNILECSYIGYEKKESVVSGEYLRIVMNEATEQLDEVVVVGYGIQKKSDLTGAISQVSSKDLEKQPSSSLGAALQGRAAGLQIGRASCRERVLRLV